LAIGDDHKSKHCDIAYLSDLWDDDAENLIGKTINRINAEEFVLKLTFTDKSVLEIRGRSFEDSALGIEYYKKGE